MRDIKFRAYDKEGQYFLGTPHMHEDFTDTRIFSDLWHDDDIIIMQYTGLKDRNGVEIYEGDIVNTTGPRPWSVEYGCYGDPHKLYVYNQLNSCRLVEYDLDKMCCIKNGGVEPLPCFTGYGGKYAEIIVIGNIYENPEMLGGL